MAKNQQKSGFTLIEILIVVAIIAILASVVLIGLGPTQQAGRDARRVSDLQEIQNGLELWYNSCGIYPGTNHCTVGTAGATWTAFQGVLTGAGLGISSVPNDPSSGQNYDYGYSAGNTSYLLEATMENGSGTVFNNYAVPTNPAPGAVTWLTGTPTCVAPQYCVTL